MADLLNIIGTGLRQLATWLGISADTLVIVISAAAIFLFLILLLALLLAARQRVAPRPQPAEAKGKPVGLEYIEKTLLEFPAGKVQIEANVDRLVFKLMETEPKVVERIVEVPAKEKPPALEPVNIEGATDLNAAVALLCKRYGMDSLTIVDEKSEVISSNSKDPKVDADLARALSPQAGWEVSRMEVRGKPSVYLYPFSKGDRRLLMLFKGGEKEQRVLDLLASDLGRMGKFL